MACSSCLNRISAFMCLHFSMKSLNTVFDVCDTYFTIENVALSLIDRIYVRIILTTSSDYSFNL